MIFLVVLFCTEVPELEVNDAKKEWDRYLELSKTEEKKAEAAREKGIVAMLWFFIKTKIEVYLPLLTLLNKDLNISGQGLGEVHD